MNASDTNTKLPVHINHRNFYYPPGGILIWILVFLELITFGAALMVMVYQGKSETELYAAMGSKMNVLAGSVNTLILLTSGYFMASGLQLFKKRAFRKAKYHLLITILLGIVFVGNKVMEYTAKLDMGLALGTNTFMNYYWLLTGFHLIHVITGLVILVIIIWPIHKDPVAVDVLDLEAGGAFWHMCDLIWLFLFPVIYLIF